MRKWATLIVLNPDEEPRASCDVLGEVVTRTLDDLRSLPRGGGPTRWTPKNPPNTVERSLVLLGQTADSGRVWDVQYVARSDLPAITISATSTRCRSRARPASLPPTPHCLDRPVSRRSRHPRPAPLPPRRPALPERPPRARHPRGARAARAGCEADAHRQEREGQGLRQDRGDLQARRGEGQVQAGVGGGVVRW